MLLSDDNEVDDRPLVMLVREVPAVIEVLMVFWLKKFNLDE